MNWIPQYAGIAATMAAVMGAFGAVFRLWLRGFSSLITHLTSEVDRMSEAHERCEEKYSNLEQRFNAFHALVLSGNNAVAARLGEIAGEPVVRDMETGETRPIRKRKGEE